VTDVKGRSYRQTNRAEQVAETRRRLVEAAIKLHATIGPARTSLSQVARAAGLSRPTLYAHFPDESALLRACTFHSLASDPPPDPQTWVQVTSAGERVRRGLAELYDYFERNESLTANILKDMYTVPAMKELHVPILETAFTQMGEILGAGFEDRTEAVRQRRRAAVAVALSFGTWQVLVRQQGLTRSRAVDMMAEFIESV
jgi:AcrR family transcriptional regulator